MAALPNPYEILDMPDGGVLDVHPTGYEIGEMIIQPRDGRPPRTIRALRLQVRPEDKPHVPSYYDITAQTLIPSLEGVLPSVIQQGRAVRITKMGVAPKARFSLEVH